MLNPVLLIAVPLGLAFLLPLLGLGSEKMGRYVPIVGTGFNLVISLLLLPKALDHPIVVSLGGWHPPLSINLVAGPLGILLSLLISSVGLLVSIYALGYIKEGARERYHTLYLLLLTGATGIVLTGDIFNLFVFFEILCISSYALVAYWGDKPGVESATKYLIQGSIGSSFILIGIGLLYGLFGTLNMADIANSISHQTAVIDQHSMALFVSLAFLVTGFGVEAAVFPLNAWLPDAHSSAPSSISAVLSGLAIKAGIYALARVVFTIFGAGHILNLLAVIGLLTLLVGELSAFKQGNIKRLLAYSSVGQVGLILFALGIASPHGVAGGLFQMVSHALAKSMLFLSVGYMIYRSGSMEISSLEGMGKRMPLTSLFFTIGAFSLVGLPPFIGFPSKLSIVRAGLERGEGLFLLLVVFVLLGTVIEGAYFLRVVQTIYFKGERGRLRREEAPVSALIPIFILAGLIVVVGVYPHLVSNLFGAAAEDLVNRMAYIRGVLGG